MNKKLIPLVVLFSLLSCTKETNETLFENEKASLELKTSLKKLENNTKNGEVLINNNFRNPVEVETSYNEFDILGQNYLTFLDELKIFVQDYQPSQSEINAFINDKLSLLSDFNVDNNNEIFELITESSGTSLNNSIDDISPYNFVETMKIYEDFVYHNVNNNTESY